MTRFDREPVEGFVQTPAGFSPDAVELLTPAGNLFRLPYPDVKAVCFIRDFDGNLIEMIDLGYMHYVLGWLGPLGGLLFRRGMYKQYYT